MSMPRCDIPAVMAMPRCHITAVMIMPRYDTPAMVAKSKQSPLPSYHLVGLWFALPRDDSPLVSWLGVGQRDLVDDWNSTQPAASLNLT